jgi:hypothetical protein
MNELQAFAAAPKIHYYASKSRELGKLASSVSGDQAASALHEKAAADASLYNLIEKVANNLIENLKTLKNPIVKGLAMGAGLAVPGVIAGKYLINDAEDSAKDVIYPALGAAGIGAAGIGAGLYGLSQMFGGSDNGSAPGKRASEDLIKQGSAAFLVAADLVKVAQETEDPELKKLANETLQVALAHVADVVGDLIL